MVFELVEYVNWDIDTTSAERCFIDYQEVQRLFYKSTSSVFKRLTIFRDGGASFKWETREKGESFSYETQKKSDFRIHPSIYFNDNEKHAEIIDNYTVNGHVYNRVYRGLRYFKCDTMGSKLTYSQRYGFLEIFDTCKYELFTFIK